MGWFSKKKKKKKVTTYFLSFSAGFAANMPGLSAIKRDISQFNRDKPRVAGLSPLNRSYGRPTFYLHHLICHLSQHPLKLISAPQVKKHWSSQSKNFQNRGSKRSRQQRWPVLAIMLKHRLTWLWPSMRNQTLC